MNGNYPAAPPAVVRLTRYTETEEAEIAGGDADPFAASGMPMTWLPAEEHFGTRLDGRLVAHAGLVVAPVRVNGVQREVVGLGGVIVAPGHRGQGLARQIVTAAVEHARGMGPAFGLLFCRPDRIPLYGGLGWRTLECHVQVEQPDGPVMMPFRSMWVPLREGAQWPPGPVRLLSLPM